MADESDPHLQLSTRFAEAVAYAAELHRDQSRKDTAIPYVAHLLGAASFVLEQEGTTEDQAIAALLHDALEDQPDRTSVEEITDRFGPAVAAIVRDCTDAATHPKPPWRHRKTAYLAHLREAPLASLQVSLADKLHNARAIATDVTVRGVEVWDRFNAPPVAQRWYYSSLAGVFTDRLASDLAAAFAATVDALVSGLPPTVALSSATPRPQWVGDDAVTGAATNLTAAAATAGHDRDALQPRGVDAWVTPDERWWIERADAGSPGRPLTVFVAPPG